jgi:hypothetical protein
MMRRWLATLCFSALAFVLVARADEPVKIKTPDKPKAEKTDEAVLDPKAVLDEQAYKNARAKQDFERFKEALFSLSKHLENSPKAEDREKAKILKEALKKASEEGTENKFDKLINILKDSKALNLDGIDTAIGQNEDLRRDIRAILIILMTDNRDKRLKEEKERLAKMIEELKRVIRAEEGVRAKNDRGQYDTPKLKKEQGDVVNKIEGLIPGGKKGPGGEGKAGAKGDPKGEGKPGESKGDGKADAKDAKGDPKEAKADGKPSDKDAKGETKDGGKKPDGGKDDPKKGDPSDKPGDGKGEGKPGDSASKAGGKGEGKGKGDGKGDGKGEGKPSDSKGGKGGESKGSGQSGSGQAGGGKGDSPSGQPKPDDKPPQDLPGKKQIEDAEKSAQKAKEKIGDDDKEATKQEGDTIDKLKEVQKKWEELLKQLREEEIERILAALQARCERMLAMQIQVRDGTVVIQKAIDGTEDKKPTRVEIQASNDQSDKEDLIVREADIAIGVLTDEGSAVAFPEVFRQVRDDMKNVSYRLKKTDTGTVTVVIENDIIQTLREMIAALQKARQENGKPQPPMPGQPGQPQPQSLLDKIAELKALRDMQKRVNARTVTYSREYPGEQLTNPETAKDPQEREKLEMLDREHKNLADRQQKIMDVATNIYKEKNK